MLPGTRADGDTTNQSALPVLAAAGFAAMLLMGGSGDNYPLLTAASELIAIILLWYMASRGSFFPRLSPGWPIKLFIVGLLFVPLIQLVPLPPALWHELPGQALPLQLLSLVGMEEGWRPISLDPEATIGSGLELLPGLAMFFAALHLPQRDRMRLAYILIGAALLSAALGALQRVGGDAQTLILFETAHSGYSPGLFVNRNHQAIFLAIGMLMASGAARSLRSSASQTGFIAFVGLPILLVFSAGVLATASRTGAALLVPALIASLLLIYPAKVPWKGAGVALLLLAFLSFILLQSSAAQDVLSRFAEIGEDKRNLYWRDSALALGQFWPVGSGIGTFPKVHATVQSLDTVGIQYVNNAHNDWLELVLEAGAPAVALMLLFLGIMLVAAARLWNRSRNGEQVSLAVAALIALLLLLLQSIFEYPLRILSIMATFGLLSGLVVAAAMTGAGELPRSRRPKS